MRSGLPYPGFRIRIPTGVSIAQPGSKFYGKIPDPKYNPNSNPNPSANCSPSYGNRVMKERGEFHPLAALHGRPKSQKSLLADLASLIWSAYQVLQIHYYQDLDSICSKGEHCPKEGYWL